MIHIYQSDDRSNSLKVKELRINRNFYPVVEIKCNQSELTANDAFWHEFNTPNCKHCERVARQFYFPPNYSYSKETTIPLLTIWPGKQVKLLLNTKKGAEDSVSLGKLLFEVSGNNVKKGDIVLKGPDENNILSDISIEQENIEVEVVVNGERGNFYNLKVYAVNSGENLLTGHLNIYIPDNDIFSETEIQPLREYLKSGPNSLYGHSCITAVIKGQEKLLNKNLKGVYQLDPLTMYTLMDTFMQKEGYIEQKFVCQYVNEKGGSDGKSKPTSMVGDIYTPINESLTGKQGYHVFGLSIYYAVHTLTMIIDNTDPCNPKYAVYDQFGERLQGGFHPFHKAALEKALLEWTKFYWDWYLENYKNEPNKGVCPSLESRIWKIKITEK